MFHQATLSILGLYNWDNTIFDDLTVPAQVDKDDLVKNILLEFAELEVLYPDPSIMKEAIEKWSDIRLAAWQKMATVLYTVYDPFVNIKRDENRTITETRNLAGSSTGTDKVNAFNETTLVDRSQEQLYTSDTGTITTQEYYHVEGDSAITDAQDVLRKEMDVRIAYDLNRIILDEFKSRFLLQIY